MKVKIFNHIEDIGQSVWNGVVAPHFPFADYAFLMALEKSGSVGMRAGWVPSYLTAWENEELVGAMALYEKKDSYGEYIFDWEWASLVQGARLPYYPKLVSAVPFTPATGPKLLVRVGADIEKVKEALLKESQAHAAKLHCHSVHALFIDPHEQTIFTDNGFLIRETHQFHWKNEGYSDFQEFLARFSRKKRQNILHERAAIAEQGLHIDCLTGDAITLEHAALMYEFYLKTIDKNCSYAYLTEEFFKEIVTTFASSTLLFLAYDKATCVAGAILFYKGDALFGRYWGAKAEYKHLHFELCYYQGIEWAIKNGLSLFEAGAQGPHKISRGFLPAFTYSAHWFLDARLQPVVAKLIQHEKMALRRGLEDFKAFSPFK